MSSTHERNPMTTTVHPLHDHVLVKRVDAESKTLLGHFDVDPCGNERSHVDAQLWYDVAHDGLAQEWHGSVFVNPPYSDVSPWAERLAAHQDPWVALVKLDPTTAWWRTLVCTPGAQWAAFRKRIKFERSDKPPLTANFPSALVWRHWTPCAELAKQLWIAGYQEAA
jgi:DNA N-6-adenine-methyltransferase (Dam)